MRHLRLIKCQRHILLANSPGVHLCPQICHIFIRPRDVVVIVIVDYHDSDGHGDDDGDDVVVDPDAGVVVSVVRGDVDQGEVEPPLEPTF